MSFLPIEPTSATNPDANAGRMPGLPWDTASIVFGDDLPAAGEIIACMTQGQVRTFALVTAAVVEAGRIEGRVVVRMNGQSWPLSTCDAALIAILVRLERQVRWADLFADALQAASKQAELKVEALHAWSRHIRPTDGDEG